MYKRTPEMAKMVQAMAQRGVPQKEIAAVLGIDIRTLTKYYGKEFEQGTLECNAKIRQTLFERAIVEGNTACLIFMCKTRLHMKETARVEMDHSSSDGSMTPQPAFDLSKFSAEELATIAKAAFRGE